MSIGPTRKSRCRYRVPDGIQNLSITIDRRERKKDEELIGPGVLTLKHSIEELNRVYTDLDLAILRLD